MELLKPFTLGKETYFSAENNMKLTNKMCGQNLEFLVLILAVNTETAGLERVTGYIRGNDVGKC
jgi:hypothetical protein